MLVNLTPCSAVLAVPSLMIHGVKAEAMFSMTHVPDVSEQEVSPSPDHANPAVNRVVGACLQALSNYWVQCSPPIGPDCDAAPASSWLVAKSGGGGAATAMREG